MQLRVHLLNYNALIDSQPKDFVNKWKKRAKPMSPIFGKLENLALLSYIPHTILAMCSSINSCLKNKFHSWLFKKTWFALSFLRPPDSNTYWDRRKCLFRWDYLFNNIFLLKLFSKHYFPALTFVLWKMFTEIMYVAYDYIKTIWNLIMEYLLEWLSLIIRLTLHHIHSIPLYV